MVADTLSTMASQEVPSMKPASRKAGRDHNEDRDSASPAIVSELFFGTLRGIGDSYQASTISKNTREEVLWKNARRPWRRSSMWLLIRVALQLTITRSADGSRDVYKNVMLFIMGRVLSSALNVSLLADYDVGVPLGLFQNLLLPSLTQMSQLSSAESYLASRKGKLPSSLLFDVKNQQSFAARYYDASESHQLLQQTIAPGRNREA